MLAHFFGCVQPEDSRGGRCGLLQQNSRNCSTLTVCVNAAADTHGLSACLTLRPSAWGRFWSCAGDPQAGSRSGLSVHVVHENGEPAASPTPCVPSDAPSRGGAHPLESGWTCGQHSLVEVMLVGSPTAVRRPTAAVERAQREVLALRSPDVPLSCHSRKGPRQNHAAKCSPAPRFIETDTVKQLFLF